jgi:lysozyme
VNITINMSDISPKRIGIGSLAGSAMLLVSLAVNEGYQQTAYRPLPGDVPTLGFGETHNIRMGETTTPTRALQTLLGSETQTEAGIKACIGVPLTQYEFDAYTSLAYNIGVSAFCQSTAARRINAGDYAGGCDAILLFNKFKGQTVAGLTARRQRERAMCKGE